MLVPSICKTLLFNYSLCRTDTFEKLAKLKNVKLLFKILIKSLHLNYSAIRSNI